MHDKNFVEGFSKLDKQQKIDWLVEHYFSGNAHARVLLERYWHTDTDIQSLHEGFIENTLTNYWLPYAVAPNFLINGRTYAVPMVTEESSVVAAAAKAAKFWYPFGGFRAQVLGKTKLGHIHLLFHGPKEKLQHFFEQTREEFLRRLKPFTENMEKRGGGILSVELDDWTHRLNNYYTLTFRFDTADSMGANFINTILEEWADYMEEAYPAYGHPDELEIIMRILSNHNPGCRVRVTVEADETALARKTGIDDYARRFETAVKIARVNPYRAVTHNKGIMNGIDAVVLATGNDFRAVEAGAHAFAASGGEYKSLSFVERENGKFVFGLEIPLALGTVGGMTRLHPLAKLSMELLGNPGAGQLMQITGAVGLAQNFSAIHSLITEGIQTGHMRMHLNNILAQLGATPAEAEQLRTQFANRKAHVRAVKDALNQLRNKD